jgi:GNAT superfamily N-acetyltransferase
MTDVYRLVETTPSVADYRRLRVIAGMTPFSEEAAARGLPNTIYGVHIEFEGKPVGMGRVTGDDGCFFVITDIAVDPAHQRRGLGRQIMTALMDWWRKNAPPSAHISLIADKPADQLYAQFGFVDPGPEAIAMEQRKA